MEPSPRRRSRAAYPCSPGAGTHAGAGAGAGAGAVGGLGSRRPPCRRPRPTQGRRSRRARTRGGLRDTAGSAQGAGAREREEGVKGEGRGEGRTFVRAQVTVCPELAPERGEVALLDELVAHPTRHRVPALVLHVTISPPTRQSHPAHKQQRREGRKREGREEESTRINDIHRKKQQE